MHIFDTIIIVKKHTQTQWFYHILHNNIKRFCTNDRGTVLLSTFTHKKLTKGPSPCHLNTNRKQPISNYALTISPKSALSEAPPTRPPSILGLENNSLAFPALTDPPY